MAALHNVTITLDEETAHWARVEAAHQNKSVSRFVRELLEGNMRRSASYDRAMADYLGRQLRPLSVPGSIYPRRDDLHDRDGLR